jgi:hypothetical protein
MKLTDAADVDFIAENGGAGVPVEEGAMTGRPVISTTAPSCGAMRVGTTR